MLRLSTAVVIAVVALRLATGWHFFNEGVKKLDPSFTSQWFLRSAKGPLVPVFKEIVAGPHGALKLLGSPRERDSVPADEADAESWGAWADQIEENWTRGLERVSGLSSEQRETAGKLTADAIETFRVYLSNEKDAISDLRHEAWRVEQWRGEASSDGYPPYLAERIAAKEQEVWSGMQGWFAAVNEAEASLVEGVAAIAGDAGPTGIRRVESAFAERSTLRSIDRLVAAVVLGSGVCLFLGLLTPVAAVVAAGFLLSVMATQPPWVAGADTTYFFYQLVEVVALLLLAVAGAGRWAGLDRLLFGRATTRVDNTSND